MQREKKTVCPFLLLENSRPISGLREPQTPFSSSGNPDFLSSCLQNDYLTAKYMPPPWLIINLLTHPPAKHSATLSLRNKWTGPTIAPSMPVEHTDHSTSIHARSPLRPLHLHLCQVSTWTRPLHRCQVSTQTIPTTSMPGQQRNIPPPSMPGTDTGQQPPQIPGQHTDHTTSTKPGRDTDHPSNIHARSTHRPHHLHPCQVNTQTTPSPSSKVSHRPPHHYSSDW